MNQDEERPRGPDDEPEKEPPTDAETYEPHLRGAREEDEDGFDSG